MGVSFLFAQFIPSRELLDKVPPHYLGVCAVLIVLGYLLKVVIPLKAQLVPPKTAENGKKDTVHMKLDTVIEGFKTLDKKVDEGFARFDARIGVLERGSSVTGNGAIGHSADDGTGAKR